MRVPPKLESMTARLERATRTPVNETGETGAVRHDPAKVKAADALQAVAAQRITGVDNAGPLERARQVWAQRGNPGIPELAARAAVDGPDEDFRALIAGASRETLSLAVDELALRVLALEGEDAALSRLLDLKVVCDAGKDLVPEYNRRMRSTPRHLRGEMMPEGLADALETLQCRLHDIRDEIQAGTFLGRIRERAGAISQAIFDAGKAIIDRFKGDEGDQGFFGAVWDRVKLIGQHLVPGPVQRMLASISNSAKDLVDALTDVEKDKRDPDALVARLCDGLAAARGTLDPAADAVAVGLMNETTAGVTAASGHELVYLKEEGKLRLNRVVGTGARIGVGGSLRAYTTNAYGEADALSGATGRSSLEVGAVVANLAFNRGHAGDKSSRSFSTIFGLGVTVSLPFLDGQAVSSITEKNIATIDLSPEQIAKIEAELDQITPGTERWTGFVGRMVAKGKGVPEPT